MDFFEPDKTTFRRFFQEHKTGIFGTILFHLVVLILLLLSQIYSVSTGEFSFIIDHPKRETVTEKQQQERTRERLIKELDARIAARSQPLRNVAVDASEPQPLRDDRQTNVAQLQDEARRIQERLYASQQQPVPPQRSDDNVPVAAENRPPLASAKGPSVLSYHLGGRKAVYMPIPVYQCFGGGDVTVQIEVNAEGKVTSATTDAGSSAVNPCLHAAARRAALRSRFATEVHSAPERQKGTIVYRFIAQ